MIRSLPPLSVTGPSPSMAIMGEHRVPSPLPPMPMGHDISRPSSTSTQSSNALVFQQSGVSLPGLSSLAAVTAPVPQLRAPFNGANHPQQFTTTASPTPTSVSGQSNPPVCQNCSTSTTPLWRRDESGSVLCNACGLFLKLHGRPRPISLKTDVIKSRNRVKSSQQQKKKPLYFNNGMPTARSEGGSPTQGFRRISNNSGSDRSHSPISRTTTPAMLGIPPHHMFDPSTIGEHAYGISGRSPSLPALHFRHPSPNSAAYMDRHLQPPHSFDPLQMANTELKTKVSELEVINGLFNDRVRQLENERQQALQREEDYQRQIAQLQDELAFFRRQSNGSKRSLEDDDSPFAKRSRTSDVSTFSILSNPSQPLPTATKS